MTARLRPSRHKAFLATGFVYFAGIFSLAFALGALRALVVAPRLGASVAVFLEIPVLLIASWLFARHLVRHQSLTLIDGAAIGAIAFALTMISEAVLAQVMRGQSLAEWGRELATPLGLVGLGGQLGFAVMPSVARENRSESST